ncbi:hypothetical protein [Corynebacterium sp.]|uniref:hypothetical protein n=1 Tax=Corynebacterium sp. TaxID=1720 RepID=UPI0026E084B3|nr:hypothetical protein [Corynebacterium sp.]MDO5511849.1 hypothetical protein [Corynebacterium sp.]
MFLRRSAYTAMAVGLMLGSLTACSNDEQAVSESPDTSAAPADLAWRNVAGLQVPTSSTDGPARTSPPEGYTHTPQGAALAAANGQAALATAPDSNWPEVVRVVTAPGPGRDQWAQARALMSVSGAVDESVASTFSGFKIADYSDEQAVVLLATTTPATVPAAEPLLTAYPVQLAWTGGDWKLVLPTQDDNIDAAEIDSLDGFTEWDEDDQ